MNFSGQTVIKHRQSAIGTVQCISTPALPAYLLGYGYQYDPGAQEVHVSVGQGRGPLIRVICSVFGSGLIILQGADILPNWPRTIHIIENM